MDEGAAVLETMGPPVADAFRLLMVAPSRKEASTRPANWLQPAQLATLAAPVGSDEVERARW